MYVGYRYHAYTIELRNTKDRQSETISENSMIWNTVLSHAPHPLQWRINRRPATFIYSSIPLSRIFRHRSFFNQASKVSHTTLNCPFPTALAAPSLRSQRLTVVLPIFFKFSFWSFIRLTSGEMTTKMCPESPRVKLKTNVKACWMGHFPKPVGRFTLTFIFFFFRQSMLQLYANNI